MGNEPRLNRSHVLDDQTPGCRPTTSRITASCSSATPRQSYRRSAGARASHAMSARSPVPRRPRVDAVREPRWPGLQGPGAGGDKPRLGSCRSGALRRPRSSTARSPGGNDPEDAHLEGSTGPRAALTRTVGSVIITTTAFTEMTCRSGAIELLHPDAGEVRRVRRLGRQAGEMLSTW